MRKIGVLSGISTVSKSANMVYNNGKLVQLDSKQEVLFFHWARELMNKGFISHIEIQPEFCLVKKVTGSVRMDGLTYKPDFVIRWNKTAQFVATEYVVTSDGKSIEITTRPTTTTADIPLLCDPQGFSIIEIKQKVLDGGGKVIDPHKARQTSMMRIKMMLHVHHRLVEVVYPDELFEKTFYPLAAACRTKKPVLIDDFIKAKRLVN